MKKPFSMIPLFFGGIAAALLAASQKAKGSGGVIVNLFTGTGLAARALKIAQSQLGVKESPLGSNRGPEVNKYLKSTGTAPGNNWCMSFVYWCVSNAAKQLKVQNPLAKDPGCLRQYRKMKEKGLAVSKPRPGDIFIMDFGGGKGHTGFVLDVAGDKFTTIEGNSNSTGSRTGIGVVSNTRSIKKMYGFIRI